MNQLKRSVLAVAAVTALSCGVSAEAVASPHGGGGGGHSAGGPHGGYAGGGSVHSGGGYYGRGYGGYGGYRGYRGYPFGFYGGIYAGFYGFPFYDPYYYYDVAPVVVESQPVVVEAPPVQPAYLYYCPASGAYYPAVPTCSQPWLKVVPDGGARY